MLSLIAETSEIPSIRHLSFTGGECFLLGSFLDELIKEGTALGLRTKCVSNGYWAVNGRAAQKRVDALATAGLQELALSTGPFHAEFVPFERVAIAAETAARAGIAVIIVAETMDDASFTPDDVREHPLIKDSIAAGRISVLANPWIENACGNGKSQPTHALADRSSLVGAAARCKSILETATVTPTLELVACCGFPIESIPELWLGSVATMSLRAVIEAAPDSLLMMWLHIDGPRKILEWVQQHEPDFVLPEGYASVCQNCHYLHRDQTAQRVLRENIRGEADRVAKLFLALEILKAGGTVGPVASSSADI